MFKHIKTINVKNKGEKTRISSETLTDFAYAEFSSAIEMLQAAQQVPLADSTQYDLMETCYRCHVTKLDFGLIGHICFEFF